jgi:hypothetical protein
VKLVLHALHEINVPLINGGEPVNVVEISTGLSLTVILGVLIVTVTASLTSAKGRAQNAVSAARRLALEYLDAEKDPQWRESIFAKLSRKRHRYASCPKNVAGGSGELAPAAAAFHNASPLNAKTPYSASNAPVISSCAPTCTPTPLAGRCAAVGDELVRSAGSARSSSTTSQARSVPSNHDKNQAAACSAPPCVAPGASWSAAWA